jgi:serine/threonine-protein kinase RsbW
MPANMERERMSEVNWIWTIDEHIASDAGEGRRIMEEILQKLAEHGWSEQDVFGVHLSLEEALVNAIKHGNQYADDKSVQIICKLSSERIWMEITDEGSGFAVEDVPDPTDDDNLEVPTGRGIMLMRNFMSFVDYNEAGNKVTLAKERSEAS